METFSEIAHCDIKLENIMITEGGQVKLIDFGFEIGWLRRFAWVKF